MNTSRYFIKLSYKGTDFFGWQIQPNAITVQETLKKAIEKLNRGREVKLTGCGRTDTGVHASEFYAHVDFLEDTFGSDMSEETIVHKLNCMLPASIAIHRFFPVITDVHSRFHATSRTYHYFIHQTKDPFSEDVSWYLRKELDMDAMNKAAALLIGEQNFKCFSKPITGGSTFICDVEYAAWKKTVNGYQFTIKANRFLRNMIRAIVGTLIEVGQGRWNLADFEKIIASQDRTKAGKSAPAQGLFLAKIEYENHPEVLE
ncbi:MAG: tRNA pseudouridine(38-40) synthase TruA [Crocinitomicaceae bacterium]